MKAEPTKVDQSKRKRRWFRRIALATITTAGILLLPLNRPDSTVFAGDEPSPKTDGSQKPRNAQPPGDPTATTAAAMPGKDIDGDPLPPGAIARLGSKRFHSTRTPIGLSFLNDGKTLALFTQDGWIEHWDASSGRLLDENRLSKGRFSRSVALAPRRELVAMCEWTRGDDQQFTNWLLLANQKHGQQVLNIRVSDHGIEPNQYAGSKRKPADTRELPIDHVALSSDGRTIAYGRDNVHFIDVDRRAEIPGIGLECRFIESLVFSQDGKSLAIGTHDSRLLVWDWGANAKPRSIEIPKSPRFEPYPIWCFEFSPDGTKLAVVNGNFDFEGVYLFDTANGRTERVFQSHDVRGIRSLAFSTDGKTLYSSTNGGVALWDVGSGNLVRQLHGLYGTTYFLAFSHDGRWLAASSEWERSMCVWNLETGEPIHQGFAAHQQPPSLIRFLQGDKQIVTAGDDATVRVWNLETSKQDRMMEHIRDPGTFNSGIRGMDASPDGKYIASSSYDDTVRLWETATGREVYRLPGHGHLGGYRCIRFTPDGKQFASWGDDDMRVNVWDVRTGKAANEFLARPGGLNMERDGLGNPPFSGMGLGPRLEAATISRDAGTLVLLLDGLRRFAIPSGEELNWWGLKGGVADQIVVSNDNRHLLSASWGVRSFPGGQKEAEKHAVELRTLADGKMLAHVDVDGSGAGPMAFSPDGHLAAIVTIGEQNRIELRKIPELSEIARIDLPSRAWAVEFSHSGKLVAASVSDSTVLVWDVEKAPSAVEATSFSASSSSAIR